MRLFESTITDVATGYREFRIVSASSIEEARHATYVFENIQTPNFRVEVREVTDTPTKVDIFATETEGGQ